MHKRRSTKPKRKKQHSIEIRSGQRELRSYKSTGLSVRKAADGSMQLVGTAIVFDSPSSQDLGFTEVVKYEAVQKSLQRNKDVFMLWQHDVSQPLARTATGQLQLTLTRSGLDFVATLPKSPLGQNAWQAVSDGTVDSVSFGFSTEKNGDKWMQDSRGNVVRELWDINVVEISPVTWASYSAPHVDARSAPADIRTKLNLRDDDDDAGNDSDDIDCDDPDNEDNPKCQDDDDEDRCDCRCERCADDDCENCTDPDCDDDDCENCPIQTRSAHMNLLLRRLRA
jgi:HK97 family phage prohead protease